MVQEGTEVLLYNNTRNIDCPWAGCELQEEGPKGDLCMRNYTMWPGGLQREGWIATVLHLGTKSWCWKNFLWVLILLSHFINPESVQQEGNVGVFKIHPCSWTHVFCEYQKETAQLDGRSVWGIAIWSEERCHVGGKAPCTLLAQREEDQCLFSGYVCNEIRKRHYSTQIPTCLGVNLASLHNGNGEEAATWTSGQIKNPHLYPGSWWTCTAPFDKGIAAYSLLLLPLPATSKQESACIYCPQI